MSATELILSRLDAVSAAADGGAMPLAHRALLRGLVAKARRMIDADQATIDKAHAAGMDVVAAFLIPKGKTTYMNESLYKDLTEHGWLEEVSWNKQNYVRLFVGGQFQ